MAWLKHYGVKGMHWGVRRYQNYDGTRIGAKRKDSGGGFDPEYKKKSVVVKAVRKGTNSKPLGSKAKDLRKEKENEALRSKMDEWDAQRKRHNDLADSFWKDVDKGVEWEQARSNMRKKAGDFYIKPGKDRSTIAFKNLEKQAKKMETKDVDPDLLKRAEKYELGFKRSRAAEKEIKQLERIVFKDNKGKIDRTNREAFHNKAAEYANDKVKNKDYTNSHYHQPMNDWFNYRNEYYRKNTNEYCKAVLDDYKLKNIDLSDPKTKKQFNEAISQTHEVQNFLRRYD